MADPNDQKLTRRALLARAVAGAVAVVTRPGLAETLSPKKTTDTDVPIVIPPLALRGFGRLSASLRRLQIGNRPASVLQIDCEDPSRARLTQAKYLSDLALMPGIRATQCSVPGGPIAALTTDGGACYAAMSDGRLITILAAASIDDLAALLQQAVPAGTPPDAFTARVDVPMYLDRFDKHGLMAYYVPFREPPNRRPTDPPYAVVEDFDFAVKSHVGLIPWDTETANDTAEGLANLSAWDWAARESRTRKLALHINTSCGPALWLTNRYRAETLQKQPQYCGADYRIGEPDIGAAGTLSWAANGGADVELGILQDTVRRYVGYPNVVGWLEPHGEADTPPSSLLVEFGAVADRAFQRFLQARYATAVDLSQAWYGDAQTIRSWDEVRVPELASFLGWGPDAIDLTGEWKFKYVPAPDGHLYTRAEARRFGNRPTPTAPVPPEWYEAAYDDRGWGGLRLPGDDRQMFLASSPAVIRRTVTVSPQWLERHSRVWLYLWDLSDVSGESYPLRVNGTAVTVAGSAQPHWGVAEITGALRPGANHIAMRLPKGFLGYRCYIAPAPPLQYPALGVSMNARWADFVGWNRTLRGEALRRGAEMIREVDAERAINFMHPDSYLDLVNRICADVGGNFHNTGYMAGFWSEYNPLVARSAGRPASAEPGSPAATAREFQAFWGRWLTEGIHSVHYFQHLGDIQWNPEIRQTFAENQSLYAMIGKYHVPRAEVAILYGLRSNALTSWPWGQDPNTNMPGGYWSFNTAYCLLKLCPRDGVTEASFADGAACRYRVIIDSNTSMMSEELVGEIERFVRAGGTFVTFGQTGRHTPTQRDSWPIQSLTGYEVLRIDPYGDGLWPQQSHLLKLATGQTVFQTAPWTSGVRGSGLSLRRTASDAQDLMLWDNGTVAAGMRAIGSGRVIHLGITFESLGDRSASPSMQALLGQIVDHLRVPPVPARAARVMLRHYISNNGLYDLWMLFNESDQSAATDLEFSANDPPQRLFEVKTGLWTAVASRGGTPGLFGLTFGPMETRLWLSSRQRYELAPLEWLELQRQWWAGTAVPSPLRLPTPAESQRHSVDLTEHWAFQAADEMSDAAVAALAATSVDDARWEIRRLGIWGLPDHAPVRRAIWRRRIAVPAAWTDGETQLWLRSWFAYTFHDRGRIFLDGQLLAPFSADGLAGIDATSLMRPGSVHVIALDIMGGGALRGVDGSAWLYHIPAPPERLDLGGTWMTTRDGIHDAGPAVLPGEMKALFATRTVAIDVAHAHRNAVVYIRAEGPVYGVLINGAMICRHPNLIGRTFSIDITPKVQFGSTNRIELVTRDPDAPCRIQAVELRFYDRGVYP